MLAERVKIKKLPDYRKIASQIVKNKVSLEDEEIRRKTDAFLARSAGSGKAKNIDPVKSREAGSFNGVDPGQLKEYIGDMIVTEKTMKKLESYAPNV